jgi:hypothetical protein
VDGWVVRTIRLNVSNPEFVSYDTMGAATPPEVAEAAQGLIRSPDFPDLPVHADDSLRDIFRTYRRHFRGFDFDHCLPYELTKGLYCYYTFAGTWSNEIMAIVLRESDWGVDADSWRIYTQHPIQTLDMLPTRENELRELVQRHLPLFVRRIKFSTHFHQLPNDLQCKEVCSLVDLARIAAHFAALQQKTMLILGAP